MQDFKGAGGASEGYGIKRFHGGSEGKVSKVLASTSKGKIIEGFNCAREGNMKRFGSQGKIIE